MPTYEYQCVNGHEFELFQRISDKPRAKCPACGGRATRIISGGAGLIFKGSGFYITDYGKDGKGPRSTSEPSEKTESSPPAETSKKDAPAPSSDKSEKASGDTEKKSTKKSGKAKE